MTGTENNARSFRDISGDFGLSPDVFERLWKLFVERFGAVLVDDGTTPVVLASAPGRVELAGNHTDHQGGRTISAAIDERAWALARPNDSNEIRVLMEGFGEATVRIDDLAARVSEQGKPVSLIRGMAAAFAQAGGALRGCEIVTYSDIPVGCGLSSSAAFEMLLGVTLRACAQAPDGKPLAFDPVTLAREGVFAERDYFGKHCGLQDQLASAHGGLLALDFLQDDPRVTPLTYDAEAFGYAIILIDCRCDHSLYTDEYACVPADMFSVARALGESRLEDVPYEQLLANLAEVRARVGDRAVLRALHYFEETRRVYAQQQALERGDVAAFVQLLRASGASSAQFLQNVSPRGDGSGAHQNAMVILALCAHVLDGVQAVKSEHVSAQVEQRTDDECCSSMAAGGYRIHGGGFGGSVLALVRVADAPQFMEKMDAYLGYLACSCVSIDVRGAYATWVFA